MFQNWITGQLPQRMPTTTKTLRIAARGRAKSETKEKTHCRKRKEIRVLFLQKKGWPEVPGRRKRWETFPPWRPACLPLAPPMPQKMKNEMKSWANLQRTNSKTNRNTLPRRRKEWWEELAGDGAQRSRKPSPWWAAASQENKLSLVVLPRFHTGVPKQDLKFFDREANTTCHLLLPSLINGVWGFLAKNCALLKALSPSLCSVKPQDRALIFAHW